MKRRPPQALKIRNGLKWRDGRPRWEPSPTLRAIGLKGVDLRRPDGTWMDRGEAIGACDARKVWADQLRLARAADAGALADLAAALDHLPPPADAAALGRRAVIADLLEHARRLLGEASPATAAAAPRGERTGARLVELYFAAADDAGDRDVTVTASTRRIYKTQSVRFLERFGERRVADITRKDLTAWYAALRATLSASNANQCLGAASAFLAYACRLTPPWIAASPATKLGLDEADGRLVCWSRAHEDAFTAWADAHGYADVADGIVAGLWTGARIGDLCAANLSDLAGEVWRFTPQKTQRKKQEAMPAIMAPLKARLERRRGQLVAAIDGAFLFDPRSGRRYTATDFSRRFAAAKAAFLATPAAPEGFAELRVQDTRDTCITRLWEAGVAPARMWAWTGHSQKSIERILRAHYLVLREEGSVAMGEELAAWAAKEG